MARVRIFLGSSSESMHIADALSSHFDQVRYEITVWQDAFTVGRYTLDELREAAKEHDFGVFILADDDVTRSRGSTTDSPRDNVIFELGLFSYRPGPLRGFVVSPANIDVKIPTDLDGVTRATFVPPDCEKTNRRRWASALRLAARTIEDAIQRAGVEMAASAPTDRRAEVESLRQESEVVRLELLRYKGAIERATAGSHTPYVEDVAQEYHVGPAPEEDRVEVQYATTPQEGMLLWRRVILASDSAPAPPDDELSIYAYAGHNPLDIVRVKDGDGHIECVVFFPEAVREGKALRWRLHFSWPGFWNPLRNGQPDNAYLDTAVAGTVAMRFHYPENETLRVLKQSHQGGLKRARGSSGRTLRWSPGAVAPGRARLDVRFER